MLFHKKIAALLATGALLISGTVLAADGVFVGRTMNGHNLTDLENTQIDAEFKRQFGSQVTDTGSKTNNPWEAKKRQTESQKKSSWGECRDYALQLRSQCYKEGRDAYACERFYEGRSLRCDKNF